MSPATDTQTAAATLRPLEAIALDPSHDNVAVALVELRPGDVVELGSRRVAIAQPIPTGHKLALAEIAEGEAILKYNEVIGRATSTIGVGDHVHVHNVVSDRLPGPGDA